MACHHLISVAAWAGEAKATTAAAAASGKNLRAGFTIKPILFPWLKRDSHVTRLIKDICNVVPAYAGTTMGMLVASASPSDGVTRRACGSIPQKALAAHH